MAKRPVLSGGLIILCALGLLACAERPPDPPAPLSALKVMTYNIRYDNPGDGVNAWPNRKEFVASLMMFYGADIICIQEGLIQQVRYLDNALEGFDYCGVGRDDGKEAGEYSAIFFRKTAVELLADSTFWLSLTPDQPSKGWDAALPRIVTWASFKSRGTSQTFFVFNTHFDHVGQVARRESAALIMRQIGRLAGNQPAIVTGDFNSAPEDSAYLTMLLPLPGTPRMRDSFSLSRLPHHGVASTFFGFDARTEGPGERIDYVFVSDGVNVLRHGTLTDFRDGRFPSDHLPVLVEFSLPRAGIH